jgi:cytochrome b561
MSVVARYTLTARCLHWTTVVLIAVVAVIGLWLAYFRPEEEGFKLRLYNIHESLGVVVWVLTLLRLAYRRRHPPPPLPAGTGPFIRFAAHANHAALYVVLILLPIVGFLATNAWGFPLKMFGLLPLPAPVGKDEALAKLLSTLHWCGALAGALLLAAHVGGVIYHSFGRKDRLLQRML